MAIDIAIPKLGMTMKEAKVVAWRFNEGDRVEKGQVVMQVETAKVTHDVEAQASGFLHILAAPGETHPVGAAVGQLAGTKEELAELQARRPAPEMPAAAPAPPCAPLAAPAASPAVGEPGKVKISPLARRLAQEHNLDFTTVRGSGPDGRIVKEDIEQAIAARAAGPAAPAAAAAPAVEAWTGEVIDGKRVKTAIPLQGMRRAIADHMVHSLRTAAQLTTMTEFDMSELVKLRKLLLAREGTLGFRASYTDLLVFIIARTLKAVPVMNASLIDGRIVLWEDVHVGVAVALQISEYESGLIVPVVKNADRKSLAEIHRAVTSVVAKAREGKVLPDDVTGSTFTITNTGTFGNMWAHGTPIINQPELAILQTGSIVERPAVVDGQVVPRPMMPASLTFDHRVLDGAPVSVFLAELRDRIENPALLILSE
jgi:pyruvate dehydrogenase E2 component (dihydrolipoamide acetyltransferase)/2-oxoglutarate dehydrogenase E2 component (dihydrolipoamide succinyltransferase)